MRHSTVLPRLWPVLQNQVFNEHPSITENPRGPPQKTDCPLWLLQTFHLKQIKEPTEENNIFRTSTERGHKQCLNTTTDTQAASAARKNYPLLLHRCRFKKKLWQMPFLKTPNTHRLKWEWSLSQVFNQQQWRYFRGSLYCPSSFHWQSGHRQHRSEVRNQQ